MKKPTKRDPIKENQALYDGNHWESWIGPRLPQSDPHSAELMREVERVFQSLNLIRECTDRHAAALIGKFPIWYLKDERGERLPTKSEQGEPLDTPAARAEIELQRWLDATLQRADSGESEQGDPFWQSVINLIVNGRASLRLWQPDRFADSPDPINRIHLHAPVDGSVLIARGDDGFIDSISYAYGQGLTEISTLEGDTLKIETDQQGEAQGEPIELDTGGRWAIAIMRGEPMISPQIKQNQNAINHAATMLLRNQEQAGFLERIFLNAQSPGEWVDDPKAPGGERFVPSERGLSHGPGEDIFLAGVPTGDAATADYTTPSVVFRDPVSIATFLDSIRGFRGFIYHAFGQGHLLIEGDGTMSGISRIQLRQDFEVMLHRQKRTIESAIANILNVVLKILGYEGLEAVVQMRISTGKLSPEERKSLIEEFDKGLLSKATTIAQLGSVEDVDAELALIAEERAEGMQRRASEPEDLAPTPIDLSDRRNNRDDSDREDPAAA